MKILLIEGDLESAELTRKVLTQHGYELAIATSAAEALAQLEQHSPSMLLLDYSLSDRGAQEILGELHKRNNSLPPLIIATRHGDGEIAITLMQVGAKECIIKDNNYLDNLATVIGRVAQEIENESKLNEVESELRESEKKYRNLSNQLETILDHIPGLVFYKDKQNHYIRLNKRTAQIHGEAKEQLIGKNMCQLYPEEQALRYYQEDLQVIETGMPLRNIEEPQETEAGLIWHNVTKVPLKDANGTIIGIVGIAMDITERKRAEAEIKTLVQQLETAKKQAEETAMTDSLTGLPNRRYFDEVLKLEFLRLQRAKEPLSLIMIDIDYFKLFNDHYGHIAGDNCLKDVARAIKGELKRSSDVVARYGGEEFVVILPNTSSHGAFSIAENIRRAVEKCSIPQQASLFLNHVTISLGLATIKPAKSNTAELVLKMADTALYRAKEAGRNRVVVAAEKDFSQS